METDSLESYALRIKRTIDSLVVIEVVQTAVVAEEIRFLCRVSDTTAWFTIFEHFLLNEKGWKSFFGIKYFVKNKKVVFGWVIRFKADDLGQASVGITKLFNRAKIYALGGVPKEQHPDVGFDAEYNQQIVEGPLLHAGPNRNILPNEGGAKPIKDK